MVTAQGSPADESPSSGPAGFPLLPPIWRIVLLAAGTLLAVLVVRNIAVEARHVLGWATAAALAAMLLSPVIQLLDRRIPRALAIVLTIVLVGALGGTVSWVYSSSVIDQVEQIQDAGPAIAEDIEQRDDRIGQVARDIDLSRQITELTDRLAERTGSGSDAIRSAALSAPTYLVSLVLTVFFLLFGPRMVSGGLEQLTPRRRDRLRPALAEAARRTQIYVWASLCQAVVNALTLWLVATWLEVPAAALVALFGALTALLPYVGVVVGWLPVLVLGIGVASLGDVAVALFVAVALQLVEALWWRRVVDRRSLHVGPAVPVVVAIVSYGVYGLGGALYGCVLAVFALAVADQLAPGEQELPTPIDDFPLATS